MDFYFKPLNYIYCSCFYNFSTNSKTVWNIHVLLNRHKIWSFRVKKGKGINMVNYPIKKEETNKKTTVLLCLLIILFFGYIILVIVLLIQNKDYLFNYEGNHNYINLTRGWRGGYWFIIIVNPYLSWPFDVIYTKPKWIT